MNEPDEQIGAHGVTAGDRGADRQIAREHRGAQHVEGHHEAAGRATALVRCRFRHFALVRGELLRTAVSRIRQRVHQAHEREALHFAVGEADRGGGLRALHRIGVHAAEHFLAELVDALAGTDRRFGFGAALELRTDGVDLAPALELGLTRIGDDLADVSTAAAAAAPTVAASVHLLLLGGLWCCLLPKTARHRPWGQQERKRVTLRTAPTSSRDTRLRCRSMIRA
jgi:hypothetical protein